jgi:hypothetical protein
MTRAFFPERCPSLKRWPYWSSVITGYDIGLRIRFDGS